MRLELSNDEVALLREILDDVFADLKGEVYKTEGAEWKRALKTREHVLESIIGKLGAASK